MQRLLLKNERKSSVRSRKRRLAFSESRRRQLPERLRRRSRGNWKRRKDKSSTSCS